ncbi:hypothetical protein NMY3_01224 [Candidatus Nitrosocosmicus oleophilus]|uniref:Uncharacterized protein n=1 Tax=Candidatus Nitrosocosmicus oleophilus TaxID=1353260 RepID=A0A654LYW5_9ARCH|nr:hypothetical protein [Candidatus Nitrosocosmicus oleophilus]ALI35429.1 hypothetical protein NMY3_01224 [Candidatus Nitrosocosmicus oleophilus]
MKSNPAILGYVQAYVDQGHEKDPIGRGELIFFADALDPNAGKIIIEFTSPPWHKTGIQPFAWDMLPPPVSANFYNTGSLNDTYVIRLVLSPMVSFQQTTIEGSKLYHRVITDIQTGRKFVDPLNQVVRLEVFRPQDESLVPQPDEPIEPMRFLEEPYSLGFLMSLPADDELEAVVRVIPYPNGVEFVSTGGKYSLRLQIDRDDQPAAFAYEIIRPGPFLNDWPEPPLPVGPPREREHEFRIRIVYSPNVSIRAEAIPARKYEILVETRKVYRVDDVPPQGSSLDDYTFTYFNIRDTPGSTPRRPVWITLFELGVGFIPYIGALYNIAQLVYSLSTGKDFWGYKVADLDFVMMGFAAVLPFALKATPAVRNLQKEIIQVIPRDSSKRILAQILDDGITRIVKIRLQRELLEAVGQIDTKSATDLARKMALYAAGKITASQFIKEFDNLVSAAFIRQLDMRKIERVMSADFKNFKNPILAEGFNEYVSRNRFADPVNWAIQQRNKNSRFLFELQTELGPNWKNILMRSRANDVRLRPVSQKELTHFDTYAVQIEDAKSLAKVNAGHGAYYEVDHILEQRFWRNDPRIVIAFDEKDLGLAILVPKGPGIAAKMPGLPISYVHTTKTQMLNYLIPHGQEALYTAQEIFDAHMFVLKHLGLDESILRSSRLLGDFKLLAKARGEPALKFRIPSRYRYSPTKGRWEAL